MCDAGLFKIACKRSARAAILKPPPDKYRSAIGGAKKKTPHFPFPPVPGLIPHPLFHPHTYPAKFPGLGEALIFFCFFSSIKGRKEDHSKAEKKRLFSVSINRFLPKTPEGRMQYAPTARYLTGFAFVLPQVSAKPAGFHSDLWQSPNPAGFRAMSCGRV